MAKTLVNIADFPCRGSRNRSIYEARSGEDRPRGLMLVPEVMEPERESLRDALVAENPLVFDIAIAREATRRRRLVLRPVPIARRRAQIIRICEPEVAMMGVRQDRLGKRRPAVASDYDLPPAA